MSDQRERLLDALVEAVKAMVLIPDSWPHDEIAAEIRIRLDHVIIESGSIVIDRDDAASLLWIDSPRRRRARERLSAALATIQENERD
jgi:hypothetical protein